MKQIKNLQNQLSNLQDKNEDLIKESLILGRYSTSKPVYTYYTIDEDGNNLQDINYNCDCGIAYYYEHSFSPDRNYLACLHTETTNDFRKEDQLIVCNLTNFNKDIIVKKTHDKHTPFIITNYHWFDVDKIIYLDNKERSQKIININTKETVKYILPAENQNNLGVISPTDNNIMIIGTNDGLYQSIDGGELEKITNTPYDSPVAFSSDGQKLIFDRSYPSQRDNWPNKFIIDIVNKTETQLSFHDDPNNEETVTSVKWIPNSNKVMLITYTYLMDSMYTKVYITDPDNLNRQIIYEDATGSSFVISPSGTKIAFMKSVKPNIDPEQLATVGGSDDHYIYVMNIDGSDIRKLTDDSTMPARDKSYFGRLSTVKEFIIGWQ